jgi:hypothetical protein
MKKKKILLICISFIIVTAISTAGFQLFAGSRYRSFYDFFKRYREYKESWSHNNDSKDNDSDSSEDTQTVTPNETDSIEPTEAPTEVPEETDTNDETDNKMVEPDDGTLSQSSQLYNLAWSNSDNHQKTSIPSSGSDSNIVLLDYDDDKSTVTKYKNQGYQVAGYISVGSWEDWRDDKANFPSNVFGESYDGWAGETWFKVSEWEDLIPGMNERMSNLKDKGFQLVEFDNIAFESGNRSDMKSYALELAKVARENSLKPLFKNGAELIDDDIEEAYSGFIVEEAFEYNETSSYKVNDKPVWFFEYDNINESKVEDWMSNVWLDTSSGWEKIK